MKENKGMATNKSTQICSIVADMEDLIEKSRKVTGDIELYATTYDIGDGACITAICRLRYLLVDIDAMVKSWHAGLGKKKSFISD